MSLVFNTFFNSVSRFDLSKYLSVSVLLRLFQRQPSQGICQQLWTNAWGKGQIKSLKVYTVHKLIQFLNLKNQLYIKDLLYVAIHLSLGYQFYDKPNEAEIYEIIHWLKNVNMQAVTKTQYISLAQHSTKTICWLNFRVRRKTFYTV